jgi:[NiFe] hydrogenase assembly HybE family chaperone
VTDPAPACGAPCAGRFPPTAVATPPGHPRVAALAARFAEIDATMRDLPLYNRALEVEAWGFAPFGADGLLGVLITPWFMNLTLLPVDPEPIAANRYGRAESVALPAGPRSFLYNGDPAVGAFRAASLHSPLDQFLSMPQARAEARLRLTEALTPPAPPEPPALSRRALFARAHTSQSGA